MGNNLILKRFFSKAVLHDLLSGNEEGIFDCVVRRYVVEPKGKPYEKLISEIYSYMDKEYRTEYYYKNTMLNKLLLKKHNYKKTIVLTELPIGNSKADFIMINGRGIVYEIKTELDNLDRINSQIDDYYKAFSEVVIVTYRDNVEKVLETVPETVGIMELTKRRALRTIRESKEIYSKLDYYTIFKILRKYEFEYILTTQGYDLPKVSQFQYYSECFNLIQKIDIGVLQKLMIKELKKRMRIETVEFSIDVPEELRFLIYFDDTIFDYKDTFFTTLNRIYGG